MRWLAIAAAAIATYEFIALLSRVRWGGDSQDKIHEDARLNRLRLIGQKGDDLWQNRSM